MWVVVIVEQLHNEIWHVSKAVIPVAKNVESVVGMELGIVEADD